MNFKEQFQTKIFDVDALMKGHVTQLSYEEYVYYIACLSEYFHYKKKYHKALYFYDHLLKTVGCNVILRQYEKMGKKIPKELNKYLVDIDDFTNDPLANKLKKKIDKIAYVHLNKRFAFQFIAIIVGLGIYALLHFLFGVDNQLSMIIGIGLAAIVPLFYKPKEITLKDKFEIDKQLQYVVRHDTDLIEFVKAHVKKDKGAPKVDENKSV